MGWFVGVIRGSGGWNVLVTSGRGNGGERVGMSVVVTLVGWGAGGMVQDGGSSVNKNGMGG